jgi:UDP-GlcNAc:undecaprenyl-phosphate GlcNAc-1-phosphate transferase
LLIVKLFFQFPQKRIFIEDRDMFENFISSEREFSWAYQFWPVTALAFIFSVAATWCCRKIALRFGIVDRPDNTVKTHKMATAYLGGVGILTGFLAGILAGIYIVCGQDYAAAAVKWLLGVLAGSIIVCFVGVLDDILKFSPRKKVLGQIAASIALIITGVMPAMHYLFDYLSITVPAGIEWAAGVIIVIAFVLGASNSLNLLDGLDGLCGGVTAVITIGLLVLAVILSTWKSEPAADPVRIIICLALLGGVCGFLPFNWNPAKIFMGDAGSMMIGFVLAAIMILFAEKSPRWWIASIFVLGLPILDTATALARRILNQRPLFVSDRGHIYDQLVDRGFSINATVLICYALAAVYAVIGIIVCGMKGQYAAAVYAAVVIVSAVVIWKMGFLKMEGLRGVKRRE